jgi:riboflavin synthase alpha subunit/DNA-binding CsgD family transcriptional regulator
MANIGRPPCADILTPAEWRVLELAQLGRSNPRIARALGVSVNTVRYHVANILKKAGATSRRELAEWRPSGRPEVERTWRSEQPASSMATVITELFRDARRHDPRRQAGGHFDVFTGRHIRPAQVVARRRNTLTLASPLAFEVEPSENIALQGVGLPVRRVDRWQLSVRLAPEVCTATTLGDAEPGDLLNAERPVRLTERLAGYPITGLTDGIARVLRIEGRELVVEVERQLRGLAVPETPIAVDGVVCTVRAVQGNHLLLAWPPRVGFQPARGHFVNVEFDSLAHLALSLLQKTAP